MHFFRNTLKQEEARPYWPSAATIQQARKGPIIFLGLSLPEHGYHAPNEFFDWGQASGGMRAFAHYFAELAKMGT
jgi:acetylornithine deacetylase/succinyl-diaminopimelate desuccinylase-like protein